MKRVPALAKPCLTLVASCMFYFKKRRMPICEFAISSEKIQRVTADGESVIPWSEVTSVHRYRQGFLIEKQNGAVSAPYLCLGQVEAVAVDAIIQNWQSVRNET